MKKLFVFIVAVFSLLTFQTKVQADSGSDGYFYNALAPYGQWIETNDGLMVWHPTFLSRTWAPYTYGNWEWTNDGWYWNTDEPFGYITYHYGRWYNDEYYGWIWVPDDQWAPSWVEWRYDDDNIGWAPLPPYAIFTAGVGIYYTQDYHPHYNYWNFVGYDHFCDANVYNYYAGPKVKYRIYNNTILRNDYDYNNGRIVNRGIGYDRIKERSGRPIVTHEIVRVTDPREINNNNGNRDVIRTYVATRNDVSRNNLNNINIKRPERNSSLDATKINLSVRQQVRSNEVNRQTERPTTQVNQENSQRQQVTDQQNRQRQDQQRQQQQVDQQNLQRQQQVDQQNRQRQQVDQQRQQQIIQQNRQKQQQVDQLNRQRQEPQIKQRMDQQNRQKQQVQQRQQTQEKPNVQKNTQTEKKAEGRDRR